MTAPFDPDAPITLKEACELHFRNRVKVATLRAEAARGRLDIFRVGRADFTTIKDLREMERRCRDDDPRRASTSTRKDGNGSSATDRLSSARAALNQTVHRLKSSSPVTLAKNTRQRRGATR